MFSHLACGRHRDQLALLARHRSQRVAATRTIEVNTILTGIGNLELFVPVSWNGTVSWNGKQHFKKSGGVAT